MSGLPSWKSVLSALFAFFWPEQHLRNLENTGELRCPQICLSEAWGPPQVADGNK